MVLGVSCGRGNSALRGSVRARCKEKALEPALVEYMVRMTGVGINGCCAEKKIYI
jgi:hypothetical protein